jgi:hypothetical protein
MPHKEFIIPASVRRLSITLHWVSGSTDVSYNALVYDEAATLLRRVHSSHPPLHDPFLSCVCDGLGNRLVAQLPQARTRDDLPVCMLLQIFEKAVYNDNDVLVLTLRDASDYSTGGELLEMRKRMKNEYKALAALLLYSRRSEVMGSQSQQVAASALRGNGLAASAETVSWVVASVYEPVFAYSLPDLDSLYYGLVIEAVPSFQRFKRKVFHDIAEICTAITTANMLFFRDHFEATEAGLAMDPFTEILFCSLAEAYPKLLERDEACYMVALLHELFRQIGSFVRQYSCCCSILCLS